MTPIASHGQPDAAGRVKLVVRPCNCGLCRASEPQAVDTLSDETNATAANVDTAQATTGQAQAEKDFRQPSGSNGQQTALTIADSRRKQH